MKKKIFIIGGIVLLLIIGIVVAVVIINSNKTEDVVEEKKELPEDVVVLEKIKYKLDQDDSEYGISYKVASNFRKTVYSNAINYYSENIDDQAYFVIRLFHYSNKSIDYAIKDTTTEYDKKYETKVGDIDYTVVHFKNFTDADVYLYYHKHNKDVYCIVFTAKIDLSRLVDIFLKNINYGE